jgi:hypothetical protein
LRRIFDPLATLAGLALSAFGVRQHDSRMPHDGMAKVKLSNADGDVDTVWGVPFWQQSLPP